MKYILWGFILTQIWEARHFGQVVFKYNSCEFSKYKKNISELTDVSILDFKITNDSNKGKENVSAYYLIKSDKDTFNVIHIFNTRSSDETVIGYKNLSTWNFKQMRDTCIVFKSHVQLNKVINYKFPVLFGDLFMITY